MLFTLLAVLASSAPAEAQNDREPANIPILVVAPDIDVLAQAVEDCAQRRCPVADDVAASLRLANAQFLAGRYQDAVRGLGRSVSRVEGRAGEAPAAVAQLYGAQSLVAKHYGDQRLERRAAAASLVTLRDHDLSPSAQLLAELRLIDAMHVRRERIATENAYADIADRAEALGEHDVAAAARFKQALLLDQRGLSTRAERLARRAMALSGLGEAARNSGRLMLARWAELRGDDAAIRALAIESGRNPDTATQMMSGTVDLSTEDAARDQVDALGFDNRTRSTDIARIGWADVAIAIGADGAVTNVDVVRRGGAQGDWLDPILGDIRERRYPVVADAAAGATRQVMERYSYTADFATPIGSLIRRRLANRRIERIVYPDD